MKKRLGYILHFAKPHWLKFSLLFTCIITTIFIGSVFHFLFGRMVEEVFRGKSMAAFVEIISLYALVFLVNQTLHFILNISWAKLMTNFLYDIRQAMFTRVLKYRGEHLVNLHTGDLTSRMQKDVEEFMNFIHWNVFYGVGATLNLLLSLGYIFYINRTLAMVVVVLTPATVYITRYFSGRIKPFMAKRKKEEGLLTAWLFEVLKGMGEIRLLGAQSHIETQYIRRSTDITRLAISASRIEVVSERTNTGISLAGQLVMFVVSALLMGTGQLTLGGFVAAMGYFSTCISAFKILNEKTVAIPGNLAGIDRVIACLEMPIEEDQMVDPVKKTADQATLGCVPVVIKKAPTIDFKGITFAYQPSLPPVFSDLDLEITGGQTTAIIGRSGEGKTTLISMLQRFFDPTSGHIKIDGVDISEMPYAKLRDMIGTVHQDAVIFDGTLRYNLGFNRQDVTEVELFEALERAHLKSFVQSLPQGLDTVLGFGGQALSGGQKQRLALARLFLKNPEIVILDEATSSLDAEGEAVIRETWQALRNDRTVIIIAHRLETILSADRVVVIDQGQVVSIGSHEALLEDCPVYRELFLEQHTVAGGGACA